MTFSHLKIIAMIIECPHHFVINHGCHVDEIKMMEIGTLYFIATSSSSH
jgi:hypothetical protein